MEFSEEQKRLLAGEVIAKGDVFSVNMGLPEGIVPHEGYETRRKYFTVVGSDSGKVLFAGIVINSEINGNLSEERKRLHKPIRKEDNSFLEHDSFIDCSDLKKVSVEKMKEFTCIGKLNPADLQVAVETLKGSEFANRSELRRFGII